jgi:hypothetical protein
MATCEEPDPRGAVGLEAIEIVAQSGADDLPRSASEPPRFIKLSGAAALQRTSYADDSFRLCACRNCQRELPPTSTIFMALDNPFCSQSCRSSFVVSQTDGSTDPWAALLNKSADDAGSCPAEDLTERPRSCRRAAILMSRMSSSSKTGRRLPVQQPAVNSPHLAHGTPHAGRKAMEPGLSEEQVEEIRESFNLLFDTDQSDSIEYRELEAAMRALGVGVHEEELHKMITDNDSDGSGCIELREFLQMMTGMWPGPSASLSKMKILRRKGQGGGAIFDHKQARRFLIPDILRLIVRGCKWILRALRLLERDRGERFNGPSGPPSQWGKEANRVYYPFD